MTREEVIESIQTEQDYVNRLAADLAHPEMREDLSMGDILTIIRYNLAKAEEAFYKEPAPYIETTNFLRKIANTSIRAGEKWQMLPRP